MNHSPMSEQPQWQDVPEKPLYSRHTQVEVLVRDGIWTNGMVRGASLVKDRDGRQMWVYMISG